MHIFNLQKNNFFYHFKNFHKKKIIDSIGSILIQICCSSI